MHLVYLTKYPESVFWSQVFEHLRFVGAEALGVRRRTLLAGIDPRAAPQARELLGERCRREGIDLATYDLWPQYPILWRASMRALRRSAVSLLAGPDPAILHVRGEVQALLARDAGIAAPGHTLVDVRGATLEEFEEFGRKPPVIGFSKRRYKRRAVSTLSEWSWLCVVSDALATHLRDSGRVDAQARIEVVPTLAAPAFAYDADLRRSTRTALGLEPDRIVVVVSIGGSSAWQRAEAAVRALSDLDVEVLNLSRTKVHRRNVVNLFVPFEEVPRYLMAADLGMLWREESTVNRVAAPVKFAEYVAAGLPVLVSDSVDDARSFVESGYPGRVLSGLHELATVDLGAMVHASDRVGQSVQGRAKYGVEVVSRRYLELYGAVHLAARTHS